MTTIEARRNAIIAKLEVTLDALRVDAYHIDRSNTGNCWELNVVLNSSDMDDYIVRALADCSDVFIRGQYTPGNIYVVVRPGNTVTGVALPAAPVKCLPHCFS